MAADRLRVLLDSQPTGPYILGGFCVGGLVAFEMARQMLQKGLKVDLVILIDASVVRFPRLRKFAAFLGFMLRLSPARQARCFSVMRRIKLRGQKLSQVSMRAQVLYVIMRTRKMLKNLFTPAKSRSRVHTFLSPRLSRVERNDAYHRVVGAYIPGPYPGRVVLLRTASTQLRAPDDPTVGWGEVASQLEVRPIPGDHFSILTADFEALAECLATCLRDVPPADRRGGFTPPQNES